MARESIPELYTPKSLDDYFNEYEQELKGSEYYNRKQLSQDDLTDAISHAYSLYDSFLQDYFDIVSEDDCERYKKDIQATYNLFRSSAPKKANRILTGEGDNGILGILLDVHKNIKDGSYTSQSNIRSHIEEITNQRKRPGTAKKVQTYNADSTTSNFFTNEIWNRINARAQSSSEGDTMEYFFAMLTRFLSLVLRHLIGIFSN